MRSAVISALARSLLAGELNAADAYARCIRTLGRDWNWLRRLTRRYAAKFAGGVRPRHRDVVQFLQQDGVFREAWFKYKHRIVISEWIAEPQRMRPAPAAGDWKLPVIENSADLADWLSLYPEELDWFADLKALGNKLGRPKLQHYRYRISSKRSGGIRLIECPKQRIKEIQRRILDGLLDRIPVHPAVHGFVKGRSIVTFAAPHTARSVLLRLDLQDFFPTFPAARVQALFRTLGYPECVADRLGGICTNAVPRGVLNDAIYNRPHLPQGAPTSPVLANLMAYRLDCRLTGLARTAGATYTRYADDLAFSGDADFRRLVRKFSSAASSIAVEEGFTVNHRKTRIMRQGTCQQLAGIVVNEKPNLRRRDLELLEAILINSIRQGPASQNREGLPDFRAYLTGRVSFVEMVHPERGRRFRQLLQAIRWI